MEKKTLLSIASVFAFTVILSACSAKTTPATDDTQEPEMSPAEATMTPEATPADASSSGTPVSMKVAPGEKEASVVADYTSPAGPEQVGFHLVVDKSGVITAAQADVMATAPISKMRQTAFATDFEAAVKGKKLSDLKKIDRVGGSSLTTGAFNSSLDKLKAEI